MAQRDPLVWGFEVLRGLWSNKTTWHPDREHFIEYNNLENAGEFKHLRRGGAHTVGSVVSGSSAYSTNMPRTGMDFSYMDTTTTGTTISHKLAVMLGNYSMYTTETGALVSWSSAFPAQNDSVNYTAEPSAVSFKNRLIICTSARPKLADNLTMNFRVGGMLENHMRFSGTADKDIAWKYPRGSVLIADGGRHVVKGIRTLQPISYSRTPLGVVTVNFSSTHILQAGQKVNVSGIPLANGERTLVTAAGTAISFNTTELTALLTTTLSSARLEDYRTLELKADYSAVNLSPSNKSIYGNRNGNLLIFDPNETRTSASLISEAGAIAPASQVTLTPYNYYHDDSTNGWVWTGDTELAAVLCTVISGDATVGFSSVIPAGVDTNAVFYLDGAAYSILSIAANRLSMEVKAEASTGTTGVYGGPGEIINVAAGLNELGLSTHRWAIFYGKLKCDVAYNYSYAYYNSLSGHLSNLAPTTQIIVPEKRFNFLITNWQDLGGAHPPVNPLHYDTIIFFRSADGSLAMQEMKRISSTALSADIDIVDAVEDTALGAITAPTAFNAPPPLFHQIAEYQERIWGIDAIDRTKIWFSADEGQIATVDEDGMGVGRAEECFPPTNYIIVPSVGGMAHTIIKAGNMLFVGTDYGLFVVVGSNELNYGFEHIFGEDGVYPGAITEYQGPLSRGTPGAFFVTQGMRAFVIAAGLGKHEIGIRVADKLVGFSNLIADERGLKIHVKYVNGSARGTNLTVGAGSYQSVKDRNYIMIHGFKGTGPGELDKGQIEALVYDIELDAWYYHTLEHNMAGTLNDQSTAQCPLVFRSSVFGLPVIFGGHMDIVGGFYYFRMDCLYNDLLTTDVGTAYSANLKSSFLDFKARKDVKVLYKAKVYTPSSGAFTLSMYRDESVISSIDNLLLAAEGEPLQEADGKEKVAHLIANRGFLQGHTFALVINFPATAGCHVEYIQFEYQLVARPE